MIIDLLLERRRRRRIQSELQESQQLMELATGAGELGLWSRDLTTGAVWANAPMRSLFGFGAHEALRFDDFVSRVHPDDRARMRSEVERAEATGRPFEGEFRTVLSGGEERWVLAKGRAAPASRIGQDGHRLGVVLDITERKRAEEALEKERSFLRQVIDIDPNFIFAKDREGRFTLANQAVAEAYGTTVDKLIGKTDADFNANNDEVESFRRADLEVIDKLRERFVPEERITDARGKVRWLQTVKRPIIEKGGGANQVLGASTDITRRKETEVELQEQRAELAHVARVSIMGELAASLAHELNQPLTAILSNAQAALRFMSNEPVDLEEVRASLQDIVKDNSRAGEIIRRMRALVKKEELEFATLDLASLIRDVVVLVRSDAILQNVRISLELDDHLPPVRGDRVQLQQVVLNIMLNAFDAMKNCPPSERQLRLRAERQDAGLVRVAASDHGTGLSVDKLDKIFQPFYTTKGEGLGMGLSICRSIIEAHGGKLWVENNPDRGATFYFTAPIEESAEGRGTTSEQGGWSRGDDKRASRNA
jgi:PAS domain S-box-containing protein